MTDAALPPRGPRFAREITGLIAAPFTIWVVGWAPALVFDITIGLVSALALYELLLLGREKGYVLPVPLCITVMLLIIAAFVLEPISVEMGVFITLLVIPASYVVGHSSLEDSLPACAIASFSTMYIGMLGGSLIRLRGDFPVVGPKLVFFLLLVVWMGDAGAYYVGKRFGRHKMSPRISPKKTIEGGIGGMVASVLVALTIRFTFFHEFPLLHTVIAGIILSMTGMIGDLAESMWKRSAGVKDSGTLLPGHGGFLDRFDSIFFTAPLLYCYWSLIVRDFRTLNIMQG